MIGANYIVKRSFPPLRCGKMLAKTKLGMTLMRIPSLLLCTTLIAATAFADQPAEINYSAYANCDPATKALVAKVLAGFGGAEKLRTIQSVRKLANIEEKTPRGDLNTEFEGIAVFPRSLYARMQLSKVEVRAVSTPDKA